MLETKSLAKCFGDKPVLQSVDMSIDTGEFVSIMGPSGEGKSTIARILCGTIFPDVGSVTMNGEVVVAAGILYNTKFRRQIQLIPQQPYAALDPRQRVGNAIEEPLLHHKLAVSRADAKQQTIDLLKQMRLDPSLYYRRPGELSGGQVQRVLIARSLTLSPRLLIADEATSMLDVSSQSQILSIFKMLIREHNISILLISHDRPLVESVSDRIYTLKKGLLY